MTALLTADEAARLRPGEQLVIVRAGDQPFMEDAASQYVDAFLDGEVTQQTHDALFAGTTFVAPKAWVALTGPCPPGCIDAGIVPLYTECPACAGVGRHFTQTVNDDHATRQCEKCRGEFIVLVGRASIAVVPVVTYGEWEIAASPTPGITIDDYGHAIYMFRGEGDGAFGFPLTLDPLPVSGRDWGILIDCIEVV